ncbi:MAG: phosphotransferase [Myxococcales bacterium]|nr:phosphotransferase [Myxococcales bacterium]MDD9965189.1 phosphotransferase [Myxococcales bacterium]
MALPESVDENLRFLIREVQQQIQRTRLYMESPSDSLRSRLKGRDSYIDNLRTFIQRACFELASEDVDVEILKAIDIIAINLERVADFCGNVVDQMDYLQDRGLFTPERFSPFVDEISRATGLIEEGATAYDINIALSVCRAEPKLDELYEEEFKNCLEGLRLGQSVETQVTLLFIFHYFERMGDSLLNIGEAIISSALGEKIKIDQLWALEDTLERVAPGQDLQDVALKGMGESRSGCRIVSVAQRSKGPGEATPVIFKEGDHAKLLEEKLGIERWEKVFPGVAPKVYAFQENGPNSAILLEYLSGRTFEQLLLEGDPLALADGLMRVTSTMHELWLHSQEPTPTPSTFVQQLELRLGDVLAVHPHFAGEHKCVGSWEIQDMRTLLREARAIEAALAAPFSVLNHGDCNVDNLICPAESDGLRVIDLHRSVMGDYVQDVSVFLVSNCRLQVFATPVRKRINQVVLAYTKFAREFAQEQGDSGFEARLAFGLARSFVTSTRFILDRRFAQRLFLRARYLLERLVSAGDDGLTDFAVPNEVLLD